MWRSMQHRSPGRCDPMSWKLGKRRNVPGKKPEPRAEPKRPESDIDLTIPEDLDRRAKPVDDQPEPQPKETYRPPLSLKPKLETHVGVDAAFRHYIDQCGAYVLR
jgi:hypothetical protein